MGHGAWGMGHGAWGMGHGAWGMGQGAWCRPTKAGSHQRRTLSTWDCAEVYVQRRVGTGGLRVVQPEGAEESQVGHHP